MTPHERAWAFVREDGKGKALVSVEVDKRGRRYACGV